MIIAPACADPLQFPTASYRQAQHTWLTAAGGAGHGLIMKIGDFGMSRQVTGPPGSPQGQGGLERTLTPETRGTVAYSSPEVLGVYTPRAGTPASELLKSDVYSFGVTLWEILMRRRPWDGMTVFQVCSSVPCDPFLGRGTCKQLRAAVGLCHQPCCIQCACSDG